jgi:two-component system response regulator HydG
MTTAILIIDDEVKMGKALKHVLVREGYDVDTIDDPQEGLRMMQARPYRVILCDLRMPGMSGLDVLERAKALQPDVNVIMMTAFASAETAVESMKKGAFDYLIKPFSMDELKILIGRCLKTQALEQENELLREQLEERFQPDNVIAASKALQQVLARARKVAASNATALISGESGTGKELLATVIHMASARHDKPMVRINCGALPETLLESELFGHRRGAFTGAIENRAGLFEACDGGTLFLDEIGEISPAMQVKLLRVLQNGEFQAVGDSRVVRVDVRVVAATNRDLVRMVEEGKFRTDLYYRLNVVPLFVPPLRERREDIPPLIEHFLRPLDPKRAKRFTAESLGLFQRYDWPGNVRELQNAVEHAVVLSEGDEMGVDVLPMPLRVLAGQGASAASAAGGAAFEDMTLREAEMRLLTAAMNRTGNNMTHAARELGITRRALGYRLRKHGLYRNEMDLGGDEEEAEGADLEGADDDTGEMPEVRR